MPDIRPRRSVLYMPGANARALEKAASLACDALIFDLEDAVSVDAKAVARQQVVEAVTARDYGHREKVVRVNGLDTEWGAADVQAFARAPVDALLFPKMESTQQVADIVACAAVDHDRDPHGCSGRSFGGGVQRPNPCAGHGH